LAAIAVVVAVTAAAATAAAAIAVVVAVTAAVANRAGNSIEQSLEFLPRPHCRPWRNPGTLSIEGTIAMSPIRRYKKRNL
jgi:hypothetical protein